AARRICSRVVSARLSSCSVTCGPRNLDSGSYGPGNRAFRKLGNHLILSSAAIRSPENAGAPVLRRTPVKLPSLVRSAFGTQGKQICEYSESLFALHNSRKVCKVLDVMTLGSAPSGRLRTTDSEVSGVVPALIPLSSGNSQWYLHAVAIA